MLIDARSIASDSPIETDICVVGAGAAGITLARHFAERSIEVCLLESGGLELDWAAQALAKGRSIGHTYSDLDSCQLRYFGGNTNAWGGWLRGLDDIDFEMRPWVEDSGWPFGAAELAPFYREAHALCEAASADYGLTEAIARVGDRGARLIPFDQAKLESVLYRFSPPTRFGQTYRSLVKNARNIKCYLHAHVLGLRATAEGRHVTGVSVGTAAGSRFSISAKIVVLAAGAIENARLLLLSNDVVSVGLGNQHDLVGRYFMDHPHTKRPFLWRDPEAKLGLYGLAFRDRGIAAGISLARALQEKERLLNYKASIYPIYRGQDSPGWAAFRGLVLSLDPQWRSDPYDRFALPFARKRLTSRQIWDMVRQFDKVALAAILQLRKPSRWVAGYVLESKPEQAPNRDSRVTLDHERDAFGLNLARVDWRLLPIDRVTVARAEAVIDAELRRLGVGKLGPRRVGEDQDPPDLVGGWHQIGTTRAHSDPRQGVVDAQLRVHGTDNLFVAGASVFPTGGSVSPTPTILALTLRLAVQLEATLKREAVSVANAARLARSTAAAVW